jgi:hypothetical protein
MQSVLKFKFKTRVSKVKGLYLGNEGAVRYQKWVESSGNWKKLLPLRESKHDSSVNILDVLTWR